MKFQFPILDSSNHLEFGILKFGILNKNYDFRSFKIKGVFTPFIFSFRIYKLIQPTRDSLLELIVINL